VAHLVPVEADLPLAQPFSQEVELLGMKPPVLARHLDGVGFIRPEQSKLKALE
jgi:hypothetical protein